MQTSFFRPASRSVDSTSSEKKVTAEIVYKPMLIIIEIKEKLSSLDDNSKEGVKFKQESIDKLKAIHDDKMIRIETRCRAMLLRARLCAQLSKAASYTPYANKANELCTRIPGLLYSVLCSAGAGDERRGILQQTRLMAVSLGRGAEEAYEYAFNCAKETYSKMHIEDWIQEEEHGVLGLSHWNAML